MLHTSSTFERDYIVDKTPYIKSGRNGWVPANYEASAADLQKRKEAMDDLRKTEVLTPPAPLVEAVKDSGTKAPRLIKADEITDSKQTKNKDKE